MLIVCLAAIAYGVVALASIVRFGLRAPDAATDAGGVSILKPIHGLEAELFENLCSFCEQDYPRYQVIFGVQRAGDPAIGVIERVIERYPDRDLALVVDERPRAGNPKMSNVAGMLERASYDLLFIVDADMRVGPSYVASVASVFSDPSTGAATCIFTGLAHGGTASQLAALQLNDQFIPSALVATIAGSPDFCFGSTMAVRRAALDAIGGIEALRPYLADDYALGHLVSKHGYRVAIPRYVVRNVVSEPSVGALFRHELRWSRTIRMSKPWGYAGYFLAFPLPLALIYLAVSGGAPAAWYTLGAACVLRAAMHAAARWAFAIEQSPPLWLVPLRDCFGIAVWACGLTGRRVQWQDQTLIAKERGLL